MVKSMTGFGKGEATLQNKKITVEIRSLNSKQMDLSLRLPAVYRQSERREGIPARNAVAAFLDEHYPDERMRRVYPNAVHTD